jgi:cysteine desulfurase/selenocysteine lyase
MINKDFETGIISFNIKEIFSQDVAFYLNKYNIYLRAGDHCAKILYNETNIKNSLRISLAFYNTKEEIDKLIMLLSDKEKIINEMI